MFCKHIDNDENKKQTKMTNSPTFAGQRYFVTQPAKREKEVTVARQS